MLCREDLYFTRSFGVAVTLLRVARFHRQVEWPKIPAPAQAGRLRAFPISNARGKLSIVTLACDMGVLHCWALVSHREYALPYKLTHRLLP